MALLCITFVLKLRDLIAWTIESIDWWPRIYPFVLWCGCLFCFGLVWYRLYLFYHFLSKDVGMNNLPPGSGESIRRTMENIFSNPVHIFTACRGHLCSTFPSPPLRTDLPLVSRSDSHYLLTHFPSCFRRALSMSPHTHAIPHHCTPPKIFTQSSRIPTLTSFYQRSSSTPSFTHNS